MKRFIVLVVVLALMALMGCAGNPGPFESPLVPGEIPELGFSGVLIAGILAGLLSLTLEYVPGFKDVWEAFQYKRESFAVAGLLVALALVGLYYLEAITLIGFPREFGWPVVWLIVEAWLGFAGSAQLTYTGVRKLNGA